MYISRDELRMNEMNIRITTIDFCEFCDFKPQILQSTSHANIDVGPLASWHFSS